jgi:ribosomal protein S13
MPMVGTKKFAYTPKGKKEAKEQSMKTGKPVKSMPVRGQRTMTNKAAKKK